jgi:ankyrin repeat protein
MHFASQNGHTETAMALVEAGADVLCKDNDGCGPSRLHPRVVCPTTVRGLDGPSTLGWGRWNGCLWLCRWTVLHYASQNGHTATAMALVELGADVHCKSNDGCGPSSCILMS